jgi:hypothetical protein
MKKNWIDELAAHEIKLDTDKPIIKKATFTDNKKLNVSKPTGKFDSKPWVTITGEAIDPEKGIRLSLDWNDEFIKFLKSNGITGSDEEQIVQKYITMLYRELMEQMEEQTSEFE